MPVFEYIIVENPTQKEAEEGSKEEIVVQTKLVVAADEQEVRTVALLKNAEALSDYDPSRLEVLVRPFV